MQPYAADQSELNTNASMRSAREVVPFIINLIQPKQVIDIGCGLGAWLSVFQEYGVKKIIGVDGDYVNRKLLRIPVESFIPHNLEKPFKVGQKFDLVLSLEVAEHLSPESSNTFIETLSNLGPAILFSAAIPYQPGESHINCQWPDYWADLFNQKGYVLFDCLRTKYWQNKNVNWWYAQNMLLFIKQSHLQSYPLLEKNFHPATLPPISMVHPMLYQMVTTQVG